MLVLKLAKDLDVEQLLGVVHHQIGGKLKEIWKTHFTTGCSPEKRLSASMLLTEVSEVNEVSILSTSLR